MATLSTTTINGNLSIKGGIYLNDGVCSIVPSLKYMNLELSQGLMTELTISQYPTLNIVGGTVADSSGLSLTDNGPIIWIPHNGSGLRGFRSLDGAEIFRIDNKGRYLCLGTVSGADYATTVANGNFKYNIAVASKSGDAYGVAYVSAHQNAILAKGSAAVTKATTVEISRYSISPLANGMLMISGTWSAQQGDTIDDNTWFEIKLPKLMQICGATVSDLSFTANGNANAWFIGKESFKRSDNGGNITPFVDAMYICKDTRNKAGTTGFSFMAIAKLQDQSQLASLFNN